MGGKYQCKIPQSDLLLNTGKSLLPQCSGFLQHLKVHLEQMWLWVVNGGLWARTWRIFTTAQTKILSHITLNLNIQIKRQSTTYNEGQTHRGGAIYSSQFLNYICITWGCLLSLQRMNVSKRSCVVGCTIIKIKDLELRLIRQQR